MLKTVTSSDRSELFQRYYGGGKGPTMTGFQPPVFVVSLRVGSREFFGEGPTAQGARHDAASKAVNHLKQLPMPEDFQCEMPQGDFGKREHCVILIARVLFL